QNSACVVVDNAGARVSEDATVPGAKERSRFEHWLAIFRDSQVLNGMPEQSAAGDSTAESEDKNIARVRLGHHRKVREKKLCADITQRGRIAFSVQAQRQMIHVVGFRSFNRDSGVG